MANTLLEAGYYDYAYTDCHHERHLQALKDHFTKESLHELVDKHRLRNQELEN